MAILSKFYSLRRQTAVQQPDTSRRSIIFNNGPVVDGESAMQVAAFYRGVIYVATQLAKLPWDIKDKANNILADDPIAFLLQVAPNVEMTAFNFKLALIQQAITYGNAYAEIERDLLGRPTALWILPTGSVQPWRDTNGRLVYKVSAGYSQSVGSTVYLQPRDIFHVKNFHTRDGITGQGVADYARETLGISLGGDRMASGIFSNAGLPSGVLKSEKPLSEAAYNRLKDSWREQYTGKKAGAVAILEDGTSFEPIKVDAQVLQFLESRKFSVIEIARFLGIPPTKLFDTGGATYSNVENANLEITTDTLDSWTTNLELEADVKLLTNRFGGKFSEIDLRSTNRGDSNTRVNYYKSMMSAGAMTPNQARNAEGLPSYPGGDRYFVATNNFTPADRIDEVIDAQVQKSEDGGQDPGNVGTPEKPDTQVDSASAELERAATLYLTNR